jgi:hypothetical protein
MANLGLKTQGIEAEKKMMAEDLRRQAREKNS